MDLIWAHGVSQRVPVARLRLIDAALWLWSRPERVGWSETSQKTLHVNYTFVIRNSSKWSEMSKSWGWARPFAGCFPKVHVSASSCQIFSWIGAAPPRCGCFYRPNPLTEVSHQPLAPKHTRRNLESFVIVSFYLPDLVLAATVPAILRPVSLHIPSLFSKIKIWI